MRYIGRANLAKRLAPLEGDPGRSLYHDGSARLELVVRKEMNRPDYRAGSVNEYVNGVKLCFASVRVNIGAQ